VSTAVHPSSRERHRCACPSPSPWVANGERLTATYQRAGSAGSSACPCVVAVQPVLELGPALAAVLGAGDALTGGLVDAVGRERMREQLVGVAVGLRVMVDPGGAGVLRAHHAAELDPDREPVGIGRVKRDRAHVMDPRPGRERPAGFAGQLAQGRQSLPPAPAVLGSVQVARLGPGVHHRRSRLLVGRGDGDGQHAAVVEPVVAVSPGEPAVVAGVQVAVERADVQAVRIAGVDRQAPRPDAAQQRARVARPRAVELEADHVIAGQREHSRALTHRARSPSSTSPGHAENPARVHMRGGTARSRRRRRARR